MPFVHHNSAGEVIAVSDSSNEFCQQEVASQEPALLRFFERLQSRHESILATDQAFIRVLEDLVNVLIEKDLIGFSDLPQDARDKMIERRSLRSEPSRQR